MLQWTLHDNGLVARDEAGWRYWMQASAVLRVRPGEGDRAPPIALFVKPPGKRRYVFHRAYKAIGGAVRAAETIQERSTNG